MNSVPIKISLLICSNHAPTATDELMKSISEQEQLACCEVVFVDNGLAKERSAEIVKQLSALPCLTQYVKEPVPGIWHARRRAIVSSTGEWLFTLDDDNILGERAISALLDFVFRCRMVGGITPRVRPRWNNTPPDWLRRFGLCCLSYTDSGDENLDSQEVVTLPGIPPYRWAPGGGMIVHQDAGKRFVQRFPLLSPQLLHRRHTAEDQFLFSLAGICGNGYAYVPDIVVYHDLPAHRLKFGQLVSTNVRMLESYGYYERYMNAASSNIKFFKIALCVILGQIKLISYHPATWILVLARMHGFLKTYSYRYGNLVGYHLTAGDC